MTDIKNINKLTDLEIAERIAEIKFGKEYVVMGFDTIIVFPCGSNEIDDYSPEGTKKTASLEMSSR